MPLDTDWSDAIVIRPRSKLPVSIRMDNDVLSFFKSQGPGYQTRMNAVLRRYMEHEVKKAGRR